MITTADSATASEPTKLEQFFATLDDEYAGHNETVSNLTIEDIVEMIRADRDGGH